MASARVNNLGDNGPPPAAAATLYPGQVMHHRLKPFGHRFTYSVFCVALDIDRLDEAGRLSPLFGVDRAAPISFHARDHLADGFPTLRSQADTLLLQAGLTERADRIILLTYPRLFGYVFNPISTWYCHAADGRLLAVIYAVSNTFGEQHTYVAPVAPGELSPAGLRQSRDKLFHVSPFISMDARYHFRVLPPGRAVRLRIHETENGSPVLAATFSGAAQALTTPALARLLLRQPFMTLKVIGGIHWEALKLWLKGARFHRSPPPPDAAAPWRDRPGLEAGE
ncbi:DUF1365 domain-containing protein [Zhengella mangrovi]|uniref:DUF1365 domain-containing protein n=1 Tax=Zhengella mangrovi TaxID=1982044 RepID=A0A2G1QS79_9HYPH|nr:DUF1365 domain-containing protein [Zhengella mangrovi]PHP68397.1 DUF1365 domain-containing protein [Zhengella mangrovi]